MGIRRGGFQRNLREVQGLIGSIVALDGLELHGWARILALECGSSAFLEIISEGVDGYPLISYGRFAYSEERRGSSDMARSLRPDGVLFMRTSMKSITCMKLGCLSEAV